MSSGGYVVCADRLPRLMQNIVAKHANLIVCAPLASCSNHAVGSRCINLLLKIRAALFLVSVCTQSLIEYRAEHCRSRPETASFATPFTLAKLLCNAVRYASREGESVLGFRIEIEQPYLPVATERLQCQ
ncbi:hypothetical protein WM21_06920 [Burkholderia ubonensis]|nr:hypothetical protein WM21_06920 [Burkholderia ubonensis]